MKKWLQRKGRSQCCREGGVAGQYRGPREEKRQMVINRTVCAGFGLLITAGDLETLGEEKGQLFDKAYWISGVQKS